MVECVIAMVIALIGLMAVYSLVVFSIRLQTISRDLAIANSFARAKTEELRNSAQTVGGSLTSNATGYYDSPSGKFTRRWQISNDPMNTRTVTVILLPNTAGTLQPEVKLATRMK